MEAERKELVAIKLTLTEREAKWLRNYVQNKMYDNESEDDAVSRERLFNALTNVLNPKT